MPLAQVLLEIVQRHAAGITFRERRAGPQLDDRMHDRGFNIKIWVDWTTGFAF